MSGSELKGGNHPGKPITVDAVDFNAWLHRTLRELRPLDRVVLKIDIEGAEVPLLQHMLNDPAGRMAPLCAVDVFFVEWHHKMMTDASKRKEATEFQDRVSKLVTAKCGKTARWERWH